MFFLQRTENNRNLTLLETSFTLYLVKSHVQSLVLLQFHNLIRYQPQLHKEKKIMKSIFIAVSEFSLCRGMLVLYVYLVSSAEGIIQMILACYVPQMWMQQGSFNNKKKNPFEVEKKEAPQSNNTSCCTKERSDSPQIPGFESNYSGRMVHACMWLSYQRNNTSFAPLILSNNFHLLPAAASYFCLPHPSPLPRLSHPSLLTASHSWYPTFPPYLYVHFAHWKSQWRTRH